MKARRTAAIVVRSLLAADRSSWVVGLLVGWVVVRRELVWPVVGSVVVAVDIGFVISLKVGWKARLPRLLTDWWRFGLGKSLWLVTLFGRWEARSATGATMEPSVTQNRNQGVKIPDEQRALIGQRDGAASGTP